MKKVFFILLATALFLSSCSSNDDIITNGNETNSTDTTKYTVNLNIKSAGFEVDKTPLKNTSSSVTKVFQYIVYNEDGSVYSDSVYWDDDVPKLFNDKNEIPLELTLPQGNYHLAVLYLPYYRPTPLGNTSFKIHPKNFDTDYYQYGDASSPRFNISGVYYEVTDLVVSASLDNNINAITLEPMWSEVTLNLKNIAKAKKPKDATSMRILYSPHYSGFNIKTKLGPGKGIAFNETLVDWTSEISVEADSTSVKYYPSKGEDNSMNIIIEYVIHSGDLQRWFVTQEIKLENKFENGRRYNISGNLPDLDLVNPSFAITINDLSSESINIPFE